MFGDYLRLRGVALKRLGWALDREWSEDKYGPLIHSLALASITLHLSVAAAPWDTEAESKCEIFARLSHVCLSVSATLSPPSVSFFCSFSVPCICHPFFLRLVHFPCLCMITENCIETVQELCEEWPMPLAGWHSTPTRDWPRAST